MDDQQVLEVALLAGKILSQASAEASRIEDTMMRILQKSQYQHIEVLAQTSNIIVSFRDIVGHKNTEMIRIQGHALALDKIHQVNEISRAICNTDISFEESYNQLSALLKQEETRECKEIVFGLWALGPSFVLVFQGGFKELVIVMILAILYVGIYRLTWKMHTLLFYLLAATVLAYCSIGIQKLCWIYQIPIELDIVIISSIMPMVPGIAITNSLRDILNQDYMSGMAKLLESLAQAVGIAFGIGFGYALGAFL